MRVGIIGGGASGLICAIKASKNHDVTIYEKNSKCGKKILITGNGKCNYFNDDFTINHYNSNNIDILSTIITEDNKNKILEFFNSIGIVPKVVNGYYYPVSGQATTILGALITEAKLCGVKFVYDVEVLDIEYNNEYIIKTNNGEYKADKLVLATGSKSAPKTGSDGLGYSLAKKFNHSIIDTVPALVQLIGSDNFYKEWAGIRSDVVISLYENNKLIKQEVGEIQLTDYGVSGICIFQLSGRVLKGISNNNKEVIEINFLPWLDINCIDYLNNRNNILHGRTITELLDGLLNYKLVNLILKKNKINSDKLYTELSNDEKNSIAEDLVHFKVNIIDSKGYESSQVTSGGIPLTEIDINSFKSLKQDNLYIIGELLDVDGNCGGYNLGFAWLSGMLAGENI